MPVFKFLTLLCNFGILFIILQKYCLPPLYSRARQRQRYSPTNTTRNLEAQSPSQAYSTENNHVIFVSGDVDRTDAEEILRVILTETLNSTEQFYTTQTAENISVKV